MTAWRGIQARTMGVRGEGYLVRAQSCGISLHSSIIPTLPATLWSFDFLLFHGHGPNFVGSQECYSARAELGPDPSAKAARDKQVRLIKLVKTRPL